MEKDTLIICVLYNPSQEILDKWSVRAKEDLDAFYCFIDNSSHKSLDFDKIVNSIYIPNYKNLGIAAAQNLGIQYAFKNGFSFIVFFDQDSDVPLNYAIDIRKTYYSIKEEVKNLCMVGPVIINKDSGVEYKNKDNKKDAPYTIANVLISTGTGVETKMFKDIGLMDEGLFIDGVDFEWCWRAQSKGYVCARSHKIQLPHKVGGKDCSFGGFPIIISAPIRYFYQYRNYLILIGRRYVPFSWKVKSGIRKLFELLLVPIFAECSKLQILKYMLKGIVAGLKY